MLELDDEPEPVDVGFVAVVSVVWLALDPFPLPPVGVRVVELDETGVKVPVIVLMLVVLVVVLLGVVVVVASDDSEEAVVDALVEDVAVTTGTDEVVELLVSPPTMWNGYEYWNMVVSESSSSSRP